EAAPSPVEKSQAPLPVEKPPASPSQASPSQASPELSAPQAVEKSAQVENGNGNGNGNGLNRIVGNPSISIKGSLKQEVIQPASDEVPPSEKESEPADEGGTGEKKAESSVVDPDLVMKAWNDYAASVEKQKPRVFSTLQNNRPVVKTDGEIRVLLNSESQKDNFHKNIRGELTTYIREATGLPMIDIVTGVLEQEQEGKKIYTDQDRLAYLVKKNPELGELKTRFGLDFDD
ncbi:MAG: hypothetical protein GY790_19695, partial [Bacteroidetes bacterium]|nr:hypothetical protein [Bacteroidota bacterium]